MAHGGPRRGAGRPKGALNKSTMYQRRAVEQVIDMRVAGHDVPLAIEVIRKYMLDAVQLADCFAPKLNKDGSLKLNKDGKPETGNEVKFAKWAHRAVAWANDLAPYETPRLATIMREPEAPPEPQRQINSMADLRASLIEQGVRPEALGRALLEYDDGEPKTPPPSLVPK